MLHAGHLVGEAGLLEKIIYGIPRVGKAMEDLSV
jgi:hypothetical protein